MCKKFKYASLTNVKIKFSTCFDQKIHFCKNTSTNHKSDIICQKYFVESYCTAIPMIPVRLNVTLLSVIIIIYVLDHIIAMCPMLNKQSVPVNGSSRKCMCSSLSGRDQMPSVVQSPNCVLLPSFDASVKNLNGITKGLLGVSHRGHFLLLTTKGDVSEGALECE